MTAGVLIKPWQQQVAESVLFLDQLELLIQVHEKSRLIVINWHPGKQTGKQESNDNKILSFRDTGQ